MHKPRCAVREQALLAIPGVGDLLEALASYSQRHFQRMDRLARSAFLLDYTLGSNRVYLGEAAAEGGAGGQPGEDLAVRGQAEGGTAAEAAPGQDRAPRMANGHAQPHEQTNGHTQSASSSDAEFGGHDPTASAAGMADSREPVHLGSEVVDELSRQDTEQQAEPRTAKRKRRKVDTAIGNGETGDGDGDAVDDDAQQAGAAEAMDDDGGDAEHAEAGADAAGRARATGPSCGLPEGSAKQKRKKKKKRKKISTAAAPVDASGARASTGSARKPKRTPS